MPRPVPLCLALALFPAPAESAPRPKAGPDEGLCFPTAVGTKWVYDGPDGEFEESITEAKADASGTKIPLVRTTAARDEWNSTFRVSTAGFDMLASGGVTYDGPLPFYKTGAKAGDGWEYTYNRQRTAFRAAVKVVGRESIEVPAGKFDAVRVDESESNSIVGAGNRNGPATESSCWYAPGVGLVRQVWQGQETRLKAFIRGEKK
jgi:hypothetical protein